MMRNVAINTIQRKGNSTWIYYGTENKVNDLQNVKIFVGSELNTSSLLKKKVFPRILVNLDIVMKHTQSQMHIYYFYYDFRR